MAVGFSPNRCDAAAGPHRSRYPGSFEPVLIFDGEYECQSDPRPDSGDLLQECRFRIILPGDLLNFAITLLDLLCYRFHFFQQRLQ